MDKKAYARAYYHANKHKYDRKEYQKQWRENNNEGTYEKRKLKKEQNPLFKLRVNLSVTIATALKNGYTERHKAFKLLGCTHSEFREHLTSLFEPWMSWDNRGLYNGSPLFGWDLDHIVPLSTATTEEELIKLNHYTNLRPLCSYVNRNLNRIKQT